MSISGYCIQCGGLVACFEDVGSARMSNGRTEYTCGRCFSDLQLTREKPVLGYEPEWLWLENRTQVLVEFIERFLAHQGDKDYAKLIECVAELARHDKWRAEMVKDVRDEK